MRLTGDRTRDIDGSILLKMRQKLITSQATPEDLRLIEEYLPIAKNDQTRLFGEELPIGIKFG